MSQYRTFTAHDAVAYAQQFGGWTPRPSWLTRRRWATVTSIWCSKFSTAGRQPHYRQTGPALRALRRGVLGR